MKKSAFVLAAVVVFAAGFTSGPFVAGAFNQGHEHRSAAGLKTMASWLYRAKTPAQMVKDADVVAVVTAGSTTPGRVVSSRNGVSSLAFELVTFTVIDSVKGPRAGETVTIERVAGVQRGIPVVARHDGDAYVPGTDHLLFLQKQPDTPYYFLMNDDGRYAIDAEGRLLGFGRGPVSAALRGRSLEPATRQLREAGGRQ